MENKMINLTEVLNNAYEEKGLLQTYKTVKRPSNTSNVLLTIIITTYNKNSKMKKNTTVSGHIKFKKGTDK